MGIFHAIILAVIEGVTEFLPVSSSGHMVMVVHLMQMPQTEFLKAFEIAVEFGAIAAVITVYWRTFLLDWEIDAKVLAAFVPTAILGVLFYKMTKAMVVGNPWVVVWSWFIGGAVIIFIERFYPTKGDIKELKKITYPQAILIGVCQSLAVLPGVSRLAAAVIGGLVMGIERKTIVEFSFLLSVPVLLAVAVLGLIKTDGDMSSDQWVILGVVFLTAFAASWAAIKFLLRYVCRHRFTAFGIYRVFAALISGFILNLLLS